MKSEDKLSDVRREIYKLTSSRFPEYRGLFVEALSLFIDATEILETVEQGSDQKTTIGASRSAAWRFMSSLPTSAHWCFESACCGDYSTSKNLLRLLLEEAIKLSYYVHFPTEALKQIVRNRDSDEVDLGEMLKQLNLEKQKGLMRLHGDLSAFYVHANLNLPPELLQKECEDRAFIVGGPRFAPELYEPIVQQVLILLVNAMKAVLTRFPRLGEDKEWSIRFEQLLPNIAKVLPD